jgi:hypothetical protein
VIFAWPARRAPGYDLPLARRLMSVPIVVRAAAASRIDTATACVRFVAPSFRHEGGRAALPHSGFGSPRRPPIRRTGPPHGPPHQQERRALHYPDECERLTVDSTGNPPIETDSVAEEADRYNRSQGLNSLVAGNFAGNFLKKEPFRENRCEISGLQTNSLLAGAGNFFERSREFNRWSRELAPGSRGG